MVLSGGTSDLVVASEAELALRWHGIQTELLLDVGVAGLHRLLDQMKRLKRSKVLIVNPVFCNPVLTKSFQKMSSAERTSLTKFIAKQGFSSVRAKNPS